MKLYTRTGDDGSTGLFGGQRVMKDDARVEAYGTVDELNAAIGWAATHAGSVLTGRDEVQRMFCGILSTLQSRLFEIGADLATPAGSKHESKIHRLAEAEVKESEDWIDLVELANPPMSHFVLPGGTELAARLHLARTICRRAERLMVHLNRQESVNPHAIVYINRISDLLFAMARRANKESGIADVPWIPR